MSLGPHDAGAYRRLLAPFLGHWDSLAQDFLRTPWDGLPRDPYRWVRFGLDAIQPATLLSRRFSGEKARGLFAGLAAHAIAPTSGIATGGIALLFALAAHEKGWPVPRGGSQAISDALASYLREQSGVIHTGTEVKRLDELPCGPRLHLRHLADRAGPDRPTGQRLPGLPLRRVLLQDRLRPVGPRPLDRRGGPPGRHGTHRPHGRMRSIPPCTPR